MLMRPHSAPSVEVVASAPDRLAVNGALTFETARRAHHAGLKLIETAPAGAAVEVDLAGVPESDSAGLSVLINWLAHASRTGRALRYVNLPAGIRAAAKISEVDELLQAPAAAAAR